MLQCQTHLVMFLRWCQVIGETHWAQIFLYTICFVTVLWAQQKLILVSFNIACSVILLFPWIRLSGWAMSATPITWCVYRGHGSSCNDIVLLKISCSTPLCKTEMNVSPYIFLMTLWISTIETPLAVRKQITTLCSLLASVLFVRWTDTTHNHHYRAVVRYCLTVGGHFCVHTAARATTFFLSDNVQPPHFNSAFFTSSWLVFIWLPLIVSTQALQNNCDGVCSPSHALCNYFQQSHLRSMQTVPTKEMFCIGFTSVYYISKVTVLF